MSSPRRLIPIAILSLAAACGPFRRGGQDDDARIIFSNQSLDEADVYAISSAGAQMRIGSVTPGRTQTLRVPPTAVGGDRGVNIVARLLARSYVPSTGRFTLNPGEVMRVTLVNDARILSLLPDQ